MTESSRGRHRAAALILWPVVLLLIVFWEPLTTSLTLFHPDWVPYFEAGYGHGLYRTFVQLGRVPSFMYTLWAMLPDRLFHALFYPVCVMGIWAVLYGLLRGRGLPRAAAMAGALAGGFAGYMLTLVSAGHRGVFEAVLSAVILLLCIDRTVRGGGPWYGVAAGLATAFTLGTQPDVLVVIGLFVAAYAVMACWSQWDAVIQNRRRFLLTLGVGLCVLVVTVLPAIHQIRDGFLPGRAAEIVRSVGGDTATVDGGAAVSDAQRWEYVTNWSLPPRDTLEFILPLFFGTETADREAPFWGELGRSMNWEPGAPGFRNFRQHTVYLGLLQVLLALFACGCAMSRRCRRALVSGDERREVVFWAVCAVVALVLSFGRYTPLYRLFYAIPLAHTVRAPVKFLHVVNLAVALLTAYGVTFLLRAFPATDAGADVREAARRAARCLALCCAGLAVVLVCGVAMVRLASTQLGGYWASVGYNAGLHDAMLRQMLAALWRSAALAAGLGIAIYMLVLRPSPRWAASVLGGLLCLVIGLDMAVTARRFVHTADLSVHESRNAMVDDIRAPVVAPRVLDLLTSRQQHDPLRVNMERYHAAAIRLLDAELPDGAAVLGQVGGDLRKLVRLLQSTGTDYVIGMHEQLAPLAQTDMFELAGGYDFANRIVRADRRREPRIALLKVASVLPRAVWVQAVRVVEHAPLDTLFDPAFDPWREVIIESHDAPSIEGWRPTGEGGPAVAASIEAWSRWRVVVTDPPSDGGALLLNEPYHADWTVRADGRPAAIVKANGSMMVVHVPKGTDRVVFTRQPGLRFFYVSTMPSMILLLVLLVNILMWGVRGMRHPV